MKIGIALNTEPAATEGVLNFIFKQKIPVFAVCLLSSFPTGTEACNDIAIFECRYFPKLDKLGVLSRHIEGLGFDEHIFKCHRLRGTVGYKQQKPYQRLKALTICENLLRRFGCTNVMSVLSVPRGIRMPLDTVHLLLTCGESKEAIETFIAAAQDKWLPQLIL